MKTEAFDAEELNLITLAREYSDEDKARALLESLRWPDGPQCPHCKAKEPYKLTPKATSKRPGRKGLYKCSECRKQFTVTVGTIFEDSHISIAVWLQAIFLMCSSKKGISSHQLHRMLGVTYKTAWFMTHRIRYAMAPGMPLAKLLEGIVEADETFVGGKPRNKNSGKRGMGTLKAPVAALVERDGNVKTRVMKRVSGYNLHLFINQTVKPGSTIHSDEGMEFKGLRKRGWKHESVNHKRGEYARDGVTSNTAESFFSLLKRGVYGAWHHVSKDHLHRYCTEFEFRWNNRKISDGERLVGFMGMVEGKRLTYQQAI